MLAPPPGGRNGRWRSDIQIPANLSQCPPPPKNYTLPTTDQFNNLVCSSRHRLILVSLDEYNSKSVDDKAGFKEDTYPPENGVGTSTKIFGTCVPLDRLYPTHYDPQGPNKNECPDGFYLTKGVCLHRSYRLVPSGTCTEPPANAVSPFANAVPQAIPPGTYGRSRRGRTRGHTMQSQNSTQARIESHTVPLATPPWMYARGRRPLGMHTRQSQGSIRGTTDLHAPTDVRNLITSLNEIKSDVRIIKNDVRTLLDNTDEIPSYENDYQFGGFRQTDKRMGRRSTMKKRK